MAADPAEEVLAEADLVGADPAEADSAAEGPEAVTVPEASEVITTITIITVPFSVPFFGREDVITAEEAVALVP